MQEPIVKSVSLFPAQIKALQAQERIILLLCSRGYGKSFTVAYWCIFKLLQGAYTGILVNATFQQLRETEKYILGHLEKLGIQYALNKRPAWCRSLLANHDNIISINAGDGKHHYLKCLSCDNVESIRGSSADFLAIDEAALADEIFIDTARPVLRGHPLGSAYCYQTLLATTPTTVSNWIYKRYIEEKQSDFTLIKAKAEENFIEYSAEKLAFIKESMTSLMYAREYDLQWTALTSNSMAYAFHDGLVSTKADKDTGRLFISCDINNIDLQTSCGYYHTNKWLHVDNEILIHEGGNPQKVAQEFHKKYNKVATKQVNCFGDRYGSNKTTTSKETYYEQLFKELKLLGWTPIDKTLDSNPSVWDSNELLMKLCEKNQFSIDANAKEIIRHLKTCQWKANEHIMDKKLLDSGFYDSLRYICWSEFKPQPRVFATNTLFR
jgi:hypothetical protein